MGRPSTEKFSDDGSRNGSGRDWPARVAVHFALLRYCCRNTITHNHAEDRPRPGTVYRCYVCRLELQWNGHAQVQEVSGGNGFSSQNDRRIHYGLGAATKIDALVIRWPSGKTQTIESPAIDKVLTVKEPA